MALVFGDVGKILAAVHTQTPADNVVGMEGLKRQPLKATLGLDGIRLIGKALFQLCELFSNHFAQTALSTAPNVAPNIDSPSATGHCRQTA